MERVLLRIMDIINDLFASDRLYDFSKIPPNEFCESFQNIVIKNPKLLGHMMFFAEQYYKTIRLNKHLLESHSLFCRNCEKMGIPAEIMRMFKDAQATQTNQQDLLESYEGECIFYVDPPVDFSTIKDLFTGNVSTFIEMVKKLMSGLQITTDKKGIPVKAIKEQLSLLCSVFCVKDGKFPEFSQTVLLMLTSSVLQFSNIPPLISIFVEYACSSKFIRWLNSNLAERTLMPDIWCNRTKIQYILYGMAQLERLIHDKYTQYNCHLEDINSIIKVLNRLLNIVEICSFNSHIIPRMDVKRVLSNMPPYESASNTTFVPMFYDILLELWMVSTIAFKVSHAEVLRIVGNMRCHNGFYKKSEKHFEQIIQRSEEFDGLILSIYSLSLIHISEPTRQIH
jgi:hypothetical protein